MTIKYFEMTFTAILLGYNKDEAQCMGHFGDDPLIPKVALTRYRQPGEAWPPPLREVLTVEMGP